MTPDACTAKSSCPVAQQQGAAATGMAPPMAVTLCRSVQPVASRQSPANAAPRSRATARSTPPHGPSLPVVASTGSNRYSSWHAPALRDATVLGLAVATLPVQASVPTLWVGRLYLTRYQTRGLWADMRSCLRVDHASLHCVGAFAGAVSPTQPGSGGRCAGHHAGHLGLHTALHGPLLAVLVRPSHPSDPHGYAPT